MLENMIIFIPEKVLIYTCVEMPVIFLVKFFNLLLPKVQFPLRKTKYFLGQFLLSLKILISWGYPLPSLLVKHNLVGNNFLTQIFYAYLNTVDRDQVTLNTKKKKKKIHHLLSRCVRKE